MKFKRNAVLLTFLFGCMLVVANADSDEAAADAVGSNEPLSESSSENDEVYEPALIQQEVEANEKKYLNMQEMEVETETEVSVKSVRNISDNQLSQEHSSTEHIPEVAHAPIQTENAEQMTSEPNMEEEEAEEDAAETLSKKSRMGRLLPTTTTTTVPDYVRQAAAAHHSQDNLNHSMSDYMDEEADMGESLKSQRNPKQTSSMVYQHVNNHQLDNFNENEEIVPLAMRYYDDDVDDDEDEDAAARSDDDEYNEGVTNKLSNEPVPMPQQQLLSEAKSQRQQPSFLPQQPNSSEEYYDGESSSSHEEDSSTAAAAAITTTSTTTAATPDDNLIVFAGFPSAYRPTTSAPATTAATSTIPSVTPVSPHNINPQYDPLFVTTIAPYPLFAAAAAAAAPATGDKKGKQIPIMPTTTIASMPSLLPGVTTSTTTTTTTTARSSSRRLLPHEHLRNYIEDAYIRMPLAVIVDPSADSLEKTKILWNDALRTNLNIKIILVTLNESDIPAAFNFNNTRQFLIGLNSIKEHEGGDAFRGISHAAELVPYDSAVFISTATLANHTDQVHDAAITLLKKRIRLYLIWFGERALSENETQETVGGILGEVAIRSGGEILHIVGSENSQELEGSTLNVIADAFRGPQEIDIPVDTTLSSLHVKIDKLMRRAVLETPNGEINLKKLVKFKSRFMTSSTDDKRLDAYVPLTKLRKATVYKLKMIPDDLESEYTVFIRGERKADTFLDDMIRHFETYFYEGQTSYPARLHDNQLPSLTSALPGPKVQTHSNLRFVDESEVKSEPKTEVETFSSKEINRNTIEEMPTNVSSIVTASNPMVQSERTTNILQGADTKIELAIQSQVLISPGVTSQLYFEVTNTGYDSKFYDIQVTDERRYLMKLVPQRIFLQPRQTATVTVTVLAPQNTQSDTIDHITFSATRTQTQTTQGRSTTSLSVNLKVTTSIDIQDNISPSISWSFGSRCESISADSTNCAERFWSLYVTAQDWQTGIMRLQSTPSVGLMYTKSATIGTTEPLKATYIATCCEPKVNLIAYDVAGNQRSNSVDVRDIVLNEASIAAITLGAILLIILIILIIAAIVWCCRRRRVVLDLPTYRSHSTRSME